MSNHHQRQTQTDKLVNSLSSRLARLDSRHIQGGNGDDNGNGHGNDGINYWRGKKIIPSDVWLKLSKAKMSGGTVDNVLEGLETFPDTFINYIWMLGIPHGEREPAIIESKVYAWYSDYIELMKHRKDSNYGKEVLCGGCLLNPKISKHGFGVPTSKGWKNLNIHKMVANAILGPTLSYHHPCPVWNRYQCPFDNDRKDVDQLFAISEIVSLVIGALARTIKTRHFSSIEESLAIGMSDVDEVYNILTDREKLTQLLEGIDDDEIKQSYDIKEIVEFFMSIKNSVREEDLLLL